MTLLKLGVGNSTFENLRPQGYLYVDKTQSLYDLIKSGNRYFLSRPRRFGKSLTCSTLKAIFLGKKELFKGLAIYDTEYKWEKHPVVHLDFSGIRHKTAEDLEEHLVKALIEIGADQGVNVEKNDSAELAFHKIITTLGKKHGPVAVIIDEYDKPILDNIENLAEAEKIRTTLKSFFGTLKNTDVDAHLHFVFVTGVSKFAKISIFSELNNLSDISLDAKAATIVGYTHEEVKYYLHDHIQEFAEHSGLSFDEMLEQLRLWYNGFRFSEAKITVYNPVSLHNCLTKHRFANYWFSTGTSNFLMKILAKNPQANQIILSDVDWQLASSSMEAFSPEVYYKKVEVLLLQTGYLTIKSYNPDSDNFTLSYPNMEIRRSITGQVFEYLASVQPEVFNNYVERLRKAIINNDMDAYCQHVHTLFQLIPYPLHIREEKYYQSLFVLIAEVIGAKVSAEKVVNEGRIDAFLENPAIAHQTKDHVYVIEFKYNKTADIAMDQIIKKEYFKKFQIEGNKQITLVGMNFKLVDGNRIDVEWQIRSA